MVKHMTHDRIAELERQTAVALAALGTSIGQALSETEMPCGVLDKLQSRARGLQASLRHSGGDAAATMFSAFAEALCQRERETHDEAYGMPRSNAAE